MNANTVFYLAAGRSLEAIKKYIADAGAAMKAWGDFAKAHGDVGYATREGFGGRYFGGLLKKPASPLWREDKGVWIPRRDTPEAKSISDTMKSLPVLQLDKAAGVIYFGEGKWSSPGFESSGGDYIILCHEKAKPPLDAVPMKRSEYWTRKERIIAESTPPASASTHEELPVAATALS